MDMRAQILFKTTTVITFFGDKNFTGGSAADVKLNDQRMIKELMPLIILNVPSETNI